MSQFHFIEGMEVAHVGNLKFKMWVKGVKTRTIDQSDGTVTDPKKGFNKIKATRMEGISCYYWISDDKKIEELFHSGTLVPWEIGQMGQAVSEEWLYENNRSFFNKMQQAKEGAINQAKEISKKYE